MEVYQAFDLGDVFVGSGVLFPGCPGGDLHLKIPTEKSGQQFFSGRCEG